MKEYKYQYVDQDHNRQMKFRLYLILTILYALGIFGLSHMNNPLNYFFGL